MQQYRQESHHLTYLSPAFVIFLGTGSQAPEKRGSYDFGEIDWDEIWSIVNGNGPCNEQRLNHHIKAHEEGEWVREAAKAYAEKQNS